MLSPRRAGYDVMELGMEVRPRQRWTQALRWAMVAAAALATLSMLPQLPRSSSRWAFPAFPVGEAMRSGMEIDLPGDDADAHGCRASAGYVWCETRSLCIRPWEQGLNSSGALFRHCHPVAEGEHGCLGCTSDEHGCIPSAGYIWCAAMGSCIRPWEKNLTSTAAMRSFCGAEVSRAFGDDRDEQGCIASAGYRWCAAMITCIRPWEEKLFSDASFKERCSIAALEFTGLRCNCPPSEAIWSCSAEAYASIRNGTSCAYYRHIASPTETHKCASCSKAALSLACRACDNHVSVSQFCNLCVEEGLNDVGCARCI
jgi:hypothetical protein